ncbi:MAG: hypothetical protein MR024_01330 [Firmicutes bacterium]|nr:hypothetical protein [Bacillota bacterium]
MPMNNEMKEFENIKSIQEMIEVLQITNENLLSGKLNYYSYNLNKVLVNCEKFFILNAMREKPINKFDEFKSNFDNLVDTLQGFGNDTKQKIFRKEKVMPDVDRKQEINKLVYNCYKQFENKKETDLEF